MRATAMALNLPLCNQTGFCCSVTCSLLLIWLSWFLNHTVAWTETNLRFQIRWITQPNAGWLSYYSMSTHLNCWTSSWSPGLPCYAFLRLAAILHLPTLPTSDVQVGSHGELDALSWISQGTSVWRLQWVLFSRRQANVVLTDLKNTKFVDDL